MAFVLVRKLIMLEYLLYKLVMVLSLCFPLRFTYWVALRVADLHYLFDRRAREAVKSNIRRILGPDRSERMIVYEARWTFRQFAKYLAEFFHFARLGPRFVEKYVMVQGAENLKEAASHGKGVIAVTGHIGNWEMGGIVLSDMGYSVTSVALEHSNPRVHVLLNQQRAGRGVEVLTIGGYLRGCYRALKEGKILALLGDRNVTEGGLELEFFGRPMMFPSGPARLSVRTGAPMVPGFMIRRFNDSWHMSLEEPIYADPTMDREEAIRDMTARFVLVLEKYVALHPSQWSIFYDFWDPPAIEKHKTDELSGQ